MRVNIGKSKFMKCTRYGNAGSNACETKWLTVRESGLFEVPVVASDN